MQPGSRRLAVERTCLRQRQFGIDEGPGLHLAFALRDAFEAGRDQRLRSQGAGMDGGAGFGGG